MSNLVRIPLESGDTFLVEVDQPPTPQMTPRGPGHAEEARESFERHLDQVLPAAEALLQKLKKIAPDEVTVEFGLTVSAEAGVFIAKAGTEANFNVTLTWQTGSDETQ